MTATITTAAELDALPVGSVVLDRDMCAWQKTLDATLQMVVWYPAAPPGESEDWDQPSDNTPFGHPQCALTAPATLPHVPGRDLIREAKVEAWDEGFARAWYAALPYEDARDASESGIPNPYEESR